MRLIHKLSLDLRRIPLSQKRKEAILILRSGQQLAYFIPRANGNIETLQIDSRLKQGYSIKQLTPNQYVIIGR